MKKTIIYALISVMCAFVYAASAEEQVPKPAAADNGNVVAEEQAQEPVVTGNESVVTEDFREEYVFPSIKPEVMLFGGYRYVTWNGSPRVDEYEYLHNSWTLGGELRLFKFPHRFHLEVDVKNRKDFFGDVGYAYEDIFVLRGVTRSLYHNLDNLLVEDLDPATNPSNPTPSLRSPWADVRDDGQLYGIQAVISTFTLRLKAPAYPFHLYFEGNQVSRDGEQQQRSLLGAGYFNNIGRSSQKRDVDNKATTTTAGANAHLGPIELDYAHSEKKFTVHGDDVLYDSYGNAGFSPPGSTRVAGVYPHNLVPELKSSTDTIRVHTSYTGALVAAATFTRTEKVNRDSGAEADYFIGSGEISWIATRDLSLFIKYRQAESRVDNPDSVEYADVCNPSLNSTGTYECTIEESISKRVRTASVAARYRLTSGVVLKGEYAHETIDREAADRWLMPLESQKNLVTLSADVRLSKKIKTNIKFIHKSIQNPAINVEPHQSNEGQISVTWTPLTWLTALASYRLTSEHRNNLQFVNDDELVDSPGDRNQRRDRFLGSVSILPVKELIATLSFFYIQDKQKEDLAYSTPVPEFLFDSGAVNQSTVRSVSFDLQYLLSKHVTLNAGVSNTESKGKFYPGDPNLLSPVSIASFSELRMRETLYTLGGQFDLKGGFSLGTNYKYARLKDLAGNPYDDIDNGEAHILVLSLTKRW